MSNKLLALWSYLKGNRGLYVASVTAVALATFFSLLCPLVIKLTIDSVIGSAPPPLLLSALIKALPVLGRFGAKLAVLAFVYISLTLLGGLFTYFKGKWCALASEDTARRIRDRLFDRLQRLPYDYHVSAETGDLIQRCTSDLETIRRFLATQLVEVGRALFMVVVSATVMLSIDVRMTLVSMAAVPIVFAFAVVFFVRIRRAFKYSDESEGRMSTSLQENLTGVRVVRAFARQQYEIDKFDNRNREFRDLTYRLIRLLAWYWSISNFICLIQIGFVLVLGGYLAAQGKISLGTMVVFFSYIGRLLWPVREMGRILTEMGKTSVSIDRIQAILDTPVEQDTGRRTKPKLRGAVEFEDVWFGYDGKEPILKGVTFRAEPGQTVAILGATGSGKSSLVHLLPRLYDYSRGLISIDGVDVRDIDKEWIRSHVGIVLQEPFLFNKTLRQNIALARSEVEEREIHEAASIAALHEVAQKFEHGYETAVGEGGVTLSGGQKQRVAIARILLKEPPILIFDDSLSAVDTETDAAIRKGLAALRKRSTTFIISHRITTLSEADLILVLENGAVAQSGTHRELLAADGMYKRIWSIQSAMEQEIGDVTR